jgi:hypothetical protein
MHNSFTIVTTPGAAHAALCAASRPCHKFTVPRKVTFDASRSELQHRKIYAPG